MSVSIGYSTPPMYDVLKRFGDHISADLRCCLPGEIKKVDLDNGTVDVLISLKREQPDGSFSDYPVLPSVPLITLQGGGVAAHFPVRIGDQCLVFFADRAMSAWKNTGAPQPIPNNRMHDLSDGFALVGVNSFNKVLDLFLSTTEGGIATKNAKVAIDQTTETITLENDAAQVVLNNQTGRVKISNQTQSLVTVLTDLNSALTTLLTALGTPPLVDTGTGNLQAAPAAAIAAAIISIGAVQVEVAGLLE